jgi:hypothetical protein
MVAPAKLNQPGTPAQTRVQKTLKNLDSRLRKNDVERLLQEARLRDFFVSRLSGWI